MDSAKFQEIQKRAKAIIDRDRRGELDKYVKNMRGERLEEGDIQFSTPQMTTQPSQASYTPMVTQQTMAHSKLPREILESFSKNPIEVPEYSGSILDEIGVPQVQQIPNEKPMMVTENKVQPTVSGVDYSLIKTIVEDCLRKSMASLKKSMLNESVNNDNQLAVMKIGESFKFVTSNGNIYEAKLVKKGNINEKKA